MKEGKGHGAVMEKKSTPEQLEKEAVARLEADEKIKLERPHKCPLCEYRAKTPSLLSRHVNHFHSEIKDQTPTHLVKVLKGKAKVSDMLASVAGWIDQATSFDDKLPEDVIAYLQKEDAKTQLILRVIAVEKIQRAMELGEEIKNLDKELKAKLKDEEFRKKASPHETLGLLERIQDIQMKELNFLKEISLLGQVNLTDVVDKLVTAFGTSRLGSAKSGSIKSLQLTAFDIPDDPAERESIRKILKRVVGTTVDEHSGRDIEAEATIKEGPGADTKGNPKDKKS